MDSLGTLAGVLHPARGPTLDRGGDATTATQLAARLPVSRQAVGKHLALLQRARLVDSERDGRETRFAATPAPLDDAIAWMTAVGAQWDDRLAALGKAAGTER